MLERFGPSAGPPQAGPHGDLQAARCCLHRRSLGGPAGRARVQRGATGRGAGFTLIELLVVIVIVAIASAAISISLRDPAASQLEREAERLTTLLESARAESRAAGVEVTWLPLVGDASGDQFRFVGLPTSVPMPRRWLGDAVAVEIVGARALKLGPEPMIGPQQVVLSIGQQRVVLSTDGLSPFQASPVGPSS